MQMADITIHVDETIDHERRQEITDSLRAKSGVGSVEQHDHTPHLMVVKFDAAKVTSAELLDHVKAQGVHAEMFGL